MSWSSGKDSAHALRALCEDPDVDHRVAMHAVRRSLLEAQANRLGLTLHIVELPAPCPNEVYERRMTAMVDTARREGVEAMAFGDLFLGDVRAYRERVLAGTGVRPIFPIWGRATDGLARQMIADGVRAVLTCVDPATLPASFAGRDFDDRLLSDLPPDVDPCGERGEFHTFVWDCPGFAEPIGVRRGEVVTRDGFVFCDLLLDQRRGGL